jgi:hypothetical protein
MNQTLVRLFLSLTLLAGLGACAPSTTTPSGTDTAAPTPAAPDAAAPTPAATDTASPAATPSP